MTPQIPNLPAWLTIYTSAESLIVAIYGHDRGRFSLHIGFLVVKDPSPPEVYSMEKIYVSQEFESFKLAFGHAEELLRSIQKQGKVFFDESMDPTKIMLKGNSKLTASMVYSMLQSLKVRSPGSVVNAYGKVQEGKVLLARD